MLAGEREDGREDKKQGYRSEVHEVAQVDYSARHACIVSISAKGANRIDYRPVRKECGKKVKAVKEQGATE